MKNQTDFSGRISVRAVFTGVMTSFSFMFLALGLIAALGIWNFNLNDLSNASSTFWISVTIAWTISLYLAGLIAALGARSQTSLEGILNALAACCGSYLLFGFSFLLFAPSSLDSLLSSATPQFFLRSFLGDVVAFGFGIYGGVVGAHYDQQTNEVYKNGRKVTTYQT